MRTSRTEFQVTLDSRLRISIVPICKSLAQLLDGLLIVRIVHYIGDLIRIDFQIVKLRQVVVGFDIYVASRSYSLIVLIPLPGANRGVDARKIGRAHV